MDSGYIVGFRSSALEDLRQLDRPIIRRVLIKLLYLARNATSFPHTALKGEWAGFCRYRVGDYRIIYRLEHDERLIIVEVAGHRRDIYE